MRLFPHALPPQPSVAVIRVFRIVTGPAFTVMSPRMSQPSTTAPGVLIVIDPEPCNVVPAGTPTVPNAGSGNPHEPGDVKHVEPGGGVGDGVGVEVGVGVAVGVGVGVGPGRGPCCTVI